ncbi:MAG: HAD family hydrolase [Acidobacteriaceae bacterium]
MKKAVFLDRDGVLNRAYLREGKPHPPDSIDQLQVFDGVRESLVRLRAAGFMLIVVTNQPDVARGKQSRQTVNSFHQALRQTFRLPVDEFRVCYDDDADDCSCRKPKPGMLMDAAREHSLDLAESYMVGDRWRDIAAGKQAGCKTVFIDHCYSEDVPLSPDVQVKSLSEATEWILCR